MVKKLLLLFPIALLLIACEKDSTEILDFAISDASVSAPAQAFKDTIRITSNEEWALTVADDVDWLHFSPKSGKGNASIIITVEANNLHGNDRKATIQVSAGQQTKDITVVQKGNTAIAVSKSELNFDFQAFEDSIQITTYSDWELSAIPDWLTVSKTKGTGNAKIVFSADANPNAEEREAGVLLSTEDVIRKVKVIQQGTNMTGWQLIFHDEFKTDGPFDMQKWSFTQRRTSEWNKYLTESPDYAYQEDGNLVLRMDDSVIAGDDVPYHSVGVKSAGKFSFKYGRVKVRAKFKEGTGSWPAIWMMPEESVYGGWPKSGEVDIMEHLNYQNKVHQVLHHDAGGPAGSAPFNKGEYNIYGIEWTPDAIKFYVNGQLDWTYNKPNGATWKAWPYDQPFYLILNQSGGGNWGGPIEDTDLPFHMKVDWVRVYQKK